MTNNYIYIYIYMLFNVLINSKKKCVNKINTFKINYSGGSSPTSTLPDIIKELRDFTQNNMNTNIKDFNEKIYIKIFDNVDEAYIVKDNYNLHIPKKYINNIDLLKDIKSKIGDIHIIFIKDYLEIDPNEQVDAEFKDIDPNDDNENVNFQFNNMGFGSVLIYKNNIFLKENNNLIDENLKSIIIHEISKIPNKQDLNIYKIESVNSQLYEVIQDIIKEFMLNENNGENKDEEDDDEEQKGDYEN